MARNRFSAPRPAAHDQAPQRIRGVDDDLRPARVGGGSVAFGAPGPKVDLDAILETWRDGATVTGGLTSAEPAVAIPAVDPPHLRVRPAPPQEVVSLSDGTKISFTVAGALLACDDP
ncbi:MAG: hypothetical protein AB7O80_10495 [Acetobacteraceae bacterium]